MPRPSTSRKPLLLIAWVGALAVPTSTVSAQLLYWLEDGRLRSYCVGSDTPDAVDVVRLPDDVGYIRSLVISSAEMSLVAGRRDFMNQWDNAIYHGDITAARIRLIAQSEWGGNLLTSTGDLEHNLLVLYWENRGSSEYNLLRLFHVNWVAYVAEFRSESVRYPEDACLTGCGQVTQMFADRNMLYRLLWRDAPPSGQRWLHVMGGWNAVIELEPSTRWIRVSDRHLYTIEGRSPKTQVVDYPDEWGLDANGEILLDEGYFEAGGAISEITFDALNPYYGDLFALHEHLISRVPRDGASPQVMYEFADSPDVSRHSLQVLDLRDGRCADFVFSDADGDGVLRPYDACPGTPTGVPVDSDGRPVGDLNGDCKVDLFDFALFQPGLRYGGP